MEDGFAAVFGLSDSRGESLFMRRLPSDHGQPNDDDECMRAGMDLMFPPFLIAGVWPDATSKGFQDSSYYTQLIRARNEGRMTPDRTKEILNAMDQVFQYMHVKHMTEAELANLIGPPDKTIVRSGRNIDVYQVHGTSGIQERFLVKD